MALIREALHDAQEEFRRAGVDSPRLTAELLIGHVLGWERVRVLAHSLDVIGTEDARRFSRLVHRRAQGEPLQYLIERQEFYGHSFRVTPAVLIPRPETELMVEAARNLAGREAWPKPRFLDAGTGSGCVAISVALGLPLAEGYATDLSMDALALARENAGFHSVKDRIRFVCGDFLECFAQRPVFDLVLSNPPYLATGDAASLPANVRDYEPHLALFGGESGMGAYQSIIPAAASCLMPGGYLVVEVGYKMSKKVAELMQYHHLSVIQVLEDLQSIPRCVVARRSHG